VCIYIYIYIYIHLNLTAISWSLGLQLVNSQTQTSSSVTSGQLSRFMHRRSSMLKEHIMHESIQSLVKDSKPVLDWYSSLLLLLYTNWVCIRSAGDIGLLLLIGRLYWIHVCFGKECVSGGPRVRTHMYFNTINKHPTLWTNTINTHTTSSKCVNYSTLDCEHN
jgi:hypothetical protein